MTKLYHVKTQADYDALMQELEEQGCEWATGHKPTDRNFFYRFVEYTIVKSKECTLWVDHLQQYNSNEIIEYTAKEKKRMKDKEWLKEEIKDEIQALLNLSKVNYFDFQQAKDNIEKTIDQLEEPEITEEQALSFIEDRGYKVARKYDEKGLVLPFDFYKQVLLNQGYIVSEKVTIPQFVADYIDSRKEIQFPLYQAIRIVMGNSEYEDSNLRDWLWKNKNQETFARAWLDGYEVEKEKLYRIKLGEGQYAQRFNSSKIDKLLTDRELAAIFTEQEIKAIDPRYMAFAEPVEEDAE